MFPRAFPVTDSGTVGGNEHLETTGVEEKKTPKNLIKKKRTRKQSQCTFSQGDKKGRKTFPAAKTQPLDSSFFTLLSNVNSQEDNAAAQRVSSARLHRIKELKNEIFDLERKIEASSLENQALRQLQCRQERAIDRYKTAENNFQDVLARHYEEMRRLRKLLRMSQEAERNMSKELRKVEAKLLKAKDALHTLVVLAEDKDLAEREELNDKLSVLTEKLEEKDEKIQSLEMQLKVNNMIFSRQLASENKKALQAGITTKNLKMEINSLHQKIKEKDRQLYIKNIYTNHLPKALKERGDSVPQEQSLSVNRAVQVDKESFSALQLSQHQETEKSPIQTIKEKNSSEDKDEEAAANGTHSDAQSRTENHSTKKMLLPETSNRKHREFMKEKEKETELLKEELKNLRKTEQSPQSDSVQDNNHEGGAVEESGKEGELEQQNNSEKARSEGATPKIPLIRLKKPPQTKIQTPKQAARDRQVRAPVKQLIPGGKIPLGSTNHRWVKAPSPGRTVPLEQKELLMWDLLKGKNSLQKNSVEQQLSGVTTIRVPTGEE